MNSQTQLTTPANPDNLPPVGNVKYTLSNLREQHAAIVAIRPLLENRKQELILSKGEAGGQPDSQKRLARINRQIDNLLNGGDPQAPSGEGTGPTRSALYGNVDILRSQLELKWGRPGVDYIGLLAIPGKLEQLEAEIESISQLLPDDSVISQAREQCSGIECEVQATKETYTLEFQKAIEHLEQARLFLSSAIDLKSSYNTLTDSMAGVKARYDLKDVNIPAKIDKNRDRECKALTDQALQLIFTVKSMILAD